MLKIILTIAVCSLISRIHGGFKPLLKLKEKYPKITKFIDGDILSPVLFALLCSLFLPWYLALGAGVGWWAGWAPDIGDRVQEIREGRYKLALQRGVFLGSCIALGSWNPAFIISGAFFPVAYYITRKGDWALSEYIMGAILAVPLIFYM